MARNEGYADVNGTRLYYEVAGEGHPLVLVHGFSLDTRMWDAQVEAFAERFQVVRYDVRGYGRSAVPTVEGYYHADDLKGLCDHLGIEGAYVVGLSLGAAISLEFALANPERVDALVLVDPVMWVFDWTPTEGPSAWELGRSAGLEAARHRWLADPLFAPALRNPVSADPLTRIISEYSGWHWMNPDPGILPSPPASEHLEDVAAPTLVVVGELDVPDFQAVSEILYSRIPGAQKVVLTGAGHMSNMEVPDDFNATVLEFLGSVEGG